MGCDRAEFEFLKAKIFPDTEREVCTSRQFYKTGNSFSVFEPLNSYSLFQVMCWRFGNDRLTEFLLNRRERKT